MWLVRIALTKPYTFIVLALLLLLLGILAIIRTPKDIFPNINIPIVSVVWTYTGLLPEEMAGRITSGYERALTTTVNNIEHIESQSLNGVSVIKIFFHPHSDIGVALSQVTAISQTVLKTLPPGATPPLVLSYNASSVPILQLVLSSPTLTEQTLNDLGNNFVRTQLAVVEGAALPYPYGGKVRQTMVDLNPEAMQAFGVSAQDIDNALQNQNLILPAGTEKIGSFEYYVKLNSSPIEQQDLNNLPIKPLKGSVLYMHDVAYVHDGSTPQTNIVDINGARAVLMTIQKTGEASTLDIINHIKALMPQIRSSMPAELRIHLFSDQSIFVKAAIRDVVQEGAAAAILTSLMILLFVGNWRSAVIITISIPLSMFASIIIFSALGQTINLMTLGGLALAVGILVDDATVTVENINWNLAQGKPLQTAILDGAKQIALPALVSSLCICIVFVPMFFLTGVAHYLFTPLAEAVIFAILTSYLLSRTLVATLANYWIRPDAEAEKRAFARFFERVRAHYRVLLTAVLARRVMFVILFLAFMLVSVLILAPWLGSDFFPDVDSGQIKLHLRAPTGTRVEETERICGEVDNIIRQLIPAQELDSLVDNIGLPTSGINLSYSNSSPVGPGDADILISLKTKHHPTADYVRKLRKILPEKIPSSSFAFLPADMATQILNFGLPAPIDIQIAGFKVDENREYANQLLAQVREIPGIVDAHIHQKFNYPQLQVDVDRTLSQNLNLTQANVVNNALFSLSGSFQIAPTFWLNTKNGVSYPLAVQTPQYYLTSLSDLENIPVTFPGKPLQILGGLATIKRTTAEVVESHFNVQPVIDIFAAVQDRDLGGVGSDIHKILRRTAKNMPKGTLVTARGQMETQTYSFNSLFAGLAFAVILVYFLIVINFQSWVDPFVIITALPAAAAGIVWMLFLTQTTLSVPALTGAIMCMGVATANSILVVSFARQRLAEGADLVTAVVDAGYTRLRPVIMTALAMIIGMFPMALGLGAGGEQNAPLGRAVIGGLLFATMATLFFVPTVFCLFHKQTGTGRSLNETA